MAEYIEREKALQLLNKNSITKKITLADGVSIYNTIEKIPTADVVEVRHGEWIAYGLRNPQCSLCKKYHISKDNYCPNCGAKMDGKGVDYA